MAQEQAMQDHASRNGQERDEKRHAAQGLPPGPTGKILRPEQAGAWRDGFRFLAEAQAAYNAERERGYADGKEAGALEATRIVGETAARVDRYLASLEREIAQLALDIVRRVLGEVDAGALIERAAIHAMADFKEAKSLEITVHPENLARVRTAVASYIRQANLGLTVTVQEDARMPRDGCTLASDFTVVDASVEGQLRALAKGFGVAP